MMLNRAFGDASSAIAPWKRGKNPCLAFFTQGRSLEEVSKIFSNFWSTAQMNPSAAPSIAGTVNSGQGMNARVTFYAPFFANTGETQAGMLAGYNWEPARGRYEELFKIAGLTPICFPNWPTTSSLQALLLIGRKKSLSQTAQVGLE